MIRVFVQLRKKVRAENSIHAFWQSSVPVFIYDDGKSENDKVSSSSYLNHNNNSNFTKYLSPRMSIQRIPICFNSEEMKNRICCLQ